VREAGEGKSKQEEGKSKPLGRKIQARGSKIQALSFPELSLFKGLRRPLTPFRLSRPVSGEITSYRRCAIGARGHSSAVSLLVVGLAIEATMAE
jgi:hypothetical protein